MLHAIMVSSGLSPVDALVSQASNMDACVRCGLCLESCPTYALTQLEEEGPRGRIAIAKAFLEGHLELTPDLVEHELSCLLCEACTAVCPAGVKMEPIGIAMREQIAAEKADPRRSRIVRRATTVLASRKRLVRASRYLRWAQRVGLLRLASMVGLLRLAGSSRHQIPDVPKQFEEPDGHGWLPADGDPTDFVQLFAGCVMSTMLAPLDVATGELLASAGLAVRVTAGQGCCGALAAHLGDVSTARELARRNIEAFGNDEPIVVNSAGCSAYLHSYGELGNGGERLSGQVVDITEFLLDRPLDLSIPWPGGPVAYQDPCHARSAQGIWEAPRELLSRIPGMALVEIDEPELCCGSAGVYNLTDPAASRQLALRKAGSIVASGARTVVTSNPGCLLQVKGALRELGAEVEVLHIVEVLRRSCPTPTQRVERIGLDGLSSQALRPA